MAEFEGFKSVGVKKIHPLNWDPTKEEKMKEMTTAEAAKQLKKPGDKVHFINEKGQRSCMVLIDQDRMRDLHEQDLKRAADRIAPETFNALKMQTAIILANEPTVSRYAEVAQDLTEILQDAYDQVGEPRSRGGGQGNIFYTHCKHINPGWDGKAQTFMNEVKGLYAVIAQIEALRS